MRLTEKQNRHQLERFPVCRAEASLPLDVQLMFGSPHHPINTQRFTSSDRRLSLAVMTYFSTFIRTGLESPEPNLAGSRRGTGF